MQAGKCPNESHKADGSVTSDDLVVYKVLHCKREAKRQRHRKCFRDGVLTLGNSVATLLDECGKKVASSKRSAELVDGDSVEIGPREVEIVERASAAEYRSGSIFAPAGTSITSASVSTAPAAPSTRPAKVSASPRAGMKSIAASSVSNQSAKVPLHEPNTEGAIVLWRPGEDEKGRNKVPVVVDPLLGKRLRPHQVQGVRFLFECTEGIRCAGGNNNGEGGMLLSGCILADSMGLGKTLQLITLIWTLLRQSPTGKPAVKRVVIACPATLVGTWEAEIHKWLGKERLSVLAIKSGGRDAKRAMQTWRNKQQRLYSVLIAGYEMIQSARSVIQGAEPGLLVMDEGHRLKSKGGSKTLSALQSLQARRRVLMTGTPLQNDLLELHALCDFVCPGVLGSVDHFRSIFLAAIRASNEEHASDEEKSLGQYRYAELSRRLDSFLLRRSGNVNAGHLPPKFEHIVFVRPAEPQLQAITAALKTEHFQSLLKAGKESGLPALAAIDLMRKIANGAQLISESDESAEAAREASQAARSHLPSNATACGSSAKLSALMKLASQMVTHTSERMVVASHSTAVLDVVQEEMKKRGWQYSRLDGTTEASKRTSLVNAFNCGHGGRFFLLSVKSGGTGLSLVGASRIALYDTDWNPASDEQALARVWRDGQQADQVHIYRLVATGTIDEKILQRQLSKTDMASMLEKGESNLKLTTEELRDLFTLSCGTCSTTRDLLLSKNDCPRHWRNNTNAHDCTNDCALKALLEDPCGDPEVTFVATLPQHEYSSDVTTSSHDGTSMTEEMHDCDHDDEGYKSEDKEHRSADVAQGGAKRKRRMLDDDDERNEDEEDDFLRSKSRAQTEKMILNDDDFW